MIRDVAEFSDQAVFQHHNCRWFRVVRQYNIAGNTLLDEVRT
jgi:hypothetical protein